MKAIAPVTRVLLGLIFSGFGLNGLLKLSLPQRRKARLQCLWVG